MRVLFLILSIIIFFQCLNADELLFENISFSSKEVQKHKIISSKYINIKNKKFPINYHVIARSGDKIGSGVFGEVQDINGKPLFISNKNDFSSLHYKEGSYFLLTQFESAPAAIYLTKLQREQNGIFKALSTKSLDLSSIGGLWVPCAGSVTPWGSHLGSEEYEPDASLEYVKRPMAKYFGNDTSKINIYNYGWIPELTILDSNGNTEIKKHYSMGRFSHELAYIMPDKRTVYMSDDGHNVGLFMFIADKAEDLSRGTLYGAKWVQNENGATLEWISLGHATDNEIKKSIDSKVKFTDIFDSVITLDGVCPKNYSSINTSFGYECLKVKKGMDKIASRLESRRYAAIKGATTEFNKLEGITYNNNENKLYLSVSSIDGGMTRDQNGADLGGSNHINLEKNICGAVYEMNLKSYVAQSMKKLIEGIQNDDIPNNSCDINNIANPDNITYINNKNILIIGEDSSSGHQNDNVWAYNTKTKKLTRIMTTPYGSETTGVYYYNNFHGFDYILSTVQHPYGESDQDKARTNDDFRAYTGYLGPLPVLSSF
ncbi:PhoX family phosphatase [Sulfurimonas sp.]|uniref:PhoX family protein n=1 Tax=Sulfurimonas sp. TaxID=2022749 RepID=UPI0035627811